MSLTKDLAPYQRLRTALTQWIDLTEPQWRRLASLFQIQSVPRQAHVLSPGTPIQDLLFVSDGLLRLYFLSEDGTETNMAFVTEETFACPLSTFSLNQPVAFGIQSLEPTTYLSTRYADFFALFDQDPAFERLGRRLSEWSLKRKELRTQSLLQQQAKDRYLAFVGQNPNLTRRVPQYHIASYLGVTEVTLSRLRRSLVQERVNL